MVYTINLGMSSSKTSHKSYSHPILSSLYPRANQLFIKLNKTLDLNIKSDHRGRKRPTAFNRYPRNDLTNESETYQFAIVKLF